jgi:putative alpha-1,2-mannosidase
MTEMAVAGFGQYAHSNQPVHHVLYLFAAAGQPWKTQRWVREVMNSLYTSQSFPGDEDNGEMSAWYVLSALGIFPSCPGHPSFTFGSPRFKSVTVEPFDRPEMQFEALENGPGKPYVRSVMVNGKPWDRLWIDHATLAAGASVTFSMTEAPLTVPVTDPDLLPFSM